MRYLSLGEALDLYHRIMRETGGAVGLRDLGALESALAQPRMAFGGQELYPTMVEKAAALAFSLVTNHPYIDGNKRLGHAAMEVFLVLNGHEIVAEIDEQERVFLQLAAGELKREAFVAWLGEHIRGRSYPAL